MKVEKLPNGQFHVVDGPRQLTQTVVPGFPRFNDCSIDRGDHVELVSQHSSEFTPLFIALHNFKIENGF
jgi:hypothetical protein